MKMMGILYYYTFKICLFRDEPFLLLICITLPLSLALPLFLPFLLFSPYLSHFSSFFPLFFIPLLYFKMFIKSKPIFTKIERESSSYPKPLIDIFKNII